MVRLPLTIALVLTCLIAPAFSESRPNVIVIFADDLGYGDVNCFSEDCPFVTPNLDTMADDGAMLTNFYVPTPYCAPSRATILTGRYPFRHTVVNNPTPDVGINKYGLPQSEITIAEMLKSKGYKTACFGKWHLGHEPEWLPRTQGFDEYLGILYSNDMYPVQLVENEAVVEYPVVQASLTRRYTDRAIDFMTAHKDEAFFLYLPHAMPHKPLAVSDNYYTPETRHDLYGDVITELDAEIGRLLKALDELNLEEQTLVIFTSDNGPWYGGSTGGLRGMKGKSWEGGLRVPLIARMPGTIPKGIVNAAPAGTIDVLPTVAALTGCELPEDRTIDGRDLLPLLKSDSATSPHEAIYSMHGQQLATIRAGQWKLHVLNPGPERLHNLTEKQLENYVDPRGPDGVTILAPFEQARPTESPGLMSGDPPQAMMLFDLEDDPGEQKDVAQQNPDVVEKLLAMFRETEQQFSEFEPVQSDYLFDIPKGKPRPLMRLIGGELRYDQVPRPQEHLMKKDKKLN